MEVGRLQLFVRFCNISGLFPFRMVLDEASGKFKHFDRHWRHPANFWFIILFMTQCTYSVLDMLVNVPFFLVSDSLIYKLGLTLDISSAIVMTWFSRHLLFQFRKFEMAFDSLVRFDEMLAKFRHCGASDIRRRTIIGIILCLITVSIMLD